MSFGGYTCSSCGYWVANGTAHNCWNNYGWQPFTYNVTPCDHCLCIPMNEDEMLSSPGLSGHQRTVAHNECCHCGKAYAVTAKGKRK